MAAVLYQQLSHWLVLSLHGVEGPSFPLPLPPPRPPPPSPRACCSSQHERAPHVRGGARAIVRGVWLAECRGQVQGPRSALPTLAPYFPSVCCSHSTGIAASHQRHSDRAGGGQASTQAGGSQGRVDPPCSKWSVPRRWRSWEKNTAPDNNKRVACIAPCMPIRAACAPVETLLLRCAHGAPHSLPPPSLLLHHIVACLSVTVHVAVAHSAPQAPPIRVTTWSGTLLCTDERP